MMNMKITVIKKLNAIKSYSKFLKRMALYRVIQETTIVMKMTIDLRL